jgi:hypothetical protein
MPVQYIHSYVILTLFAIVQSCVSHQHVEIQRSSYACKLINIHACVCRSVLMDVQVIFTLPYTHTLPLLRCRGLRQLTNQPHFSSIRRGETLASTLSNFNYNKKNVYHGNNSQTKRHKSLCIHQAVTWHIRAFAVTIVPIVKLLGLLSLLFPLEECEYCYEVSRINSCLV